MALAQLWWDIARDETRRARGVLRNWMERYMAAWSSNDPEEIGALFTDDALYYSEPFAAPWRGRTEIIERWLARKDEPGQATFEWQPLVVTPELVVVTGTRGISSRRPCTAISG